MHTSVVNEPWQSLCLNLNFGMSFAGNFKNSGKKVQMKVLQNSGT